MRSARVLLVLAALGCGGGSQEPEAVSQVSARGLRRAGEERKAPVPEPAPAAEDPPAVRFPLEPQPTAPSEPAQAEKPAKERDYSAELLGALGNSSNCVRPRLAGSAPAQDIQVELEAYVMAGGNVSRSYVRSGQLDGEESECIRRRLEGVRLAAPIEGAPRAIRASFKLALKIGPKQAG